MRKSTSAHASAAITLLRVPPWITPGFTVIPRERSVNFTISKKLASQFNNGAAAFFKVHARVRRPAAHPDRDIANAFA